MLNGLVINEDNSHFFGSRTPGQMTLEHLHAFIDQYADTQVSHMFLCPNAMRANYRSTARDSIWDTNTSRKLSFVEDAPEQHAVNWVNTAQLLDQKGLDPYAVWIDRCRTKDLSPWLSMRMNDVHSTEDLDNFMHSTFWKEHPQYWRVPGSPRSYRDRALDYGIAAVREHNMALIRELLERYDPDGIELDWMRFGFHFRPGHEAEGCEILNDFTRQVRRLTRQWSDKRGHEIKLAARVPTHPDAARGLGMDGVAWAREDLIDMLIITPFWETAHFDIPIEQWRELIGPAADNVTLAAGMEIRIQAYPGPVAVRNDIESMRGFTAAMLHRGADQIYLFNHMDCDTTVDKADEYRQILNQAARLETVLDKPRRHIVTFPDTYPPGMVRPIALPTAVDQVNPAQFRLYLGPAPTAGRLIIRAGLAERPDMSAAQFAARLNSTDCQPLPDFSDPAKFPNAARVVCFDAPLAAGQDGYNLVEVFLKSTNEQQIVWLEVYIDPQTS